jgi:hypothetical protein
MFQIKMKQIKEGCPNGTELALIQFIHFVAEFESCISPLPSEGKP